ncbi:MAG: sugar O-acetyltransferase [Casimicrobiaceae bacterium]
MKARASERDAQARMLAGTLYDPADPALMLARRRARKLTHDFNHAPPGAVALRGRLLRRLLGRCGATVLVEPPFFCDYGTHIELGDNVFINFNCVMLDCAPIVVGARTSLGPGVMLLAATHPLDAATRRSGLESAAPIRVGDDVWLGAGAIVCPGVTIGSGSVVGAGSVVVRDLPANVVALGNPCRVLRRL